MRGISECVEEIRHQHGNNNVNGKIRYKTMRSFKNRESLQKFLAS